VTAFALSPLGVMDMADGVSAKNDPAVTTTLTNIPRTERFSGEICPHQFMVDDCNPWTKEAIPLAAIAY
jgi:hypothetical protein